MSDLIEEHKYQKRRVSKGRRKLLQSTVAFIGGVAASSLHLVAKPSSVETIQEPEAPFLMQSIVQNVAISMPAFCVLLYVLDINKRQIIQSAKAGSGSDRFKIASFEEIMNGLSGRVLHTLKPALSTKSLTDYNSVKISQIQYFRSERNLGSSIVIPLCYRSKELGTLTAMNHVNGPDFTLSDVERMVNIANESALLI